MNEKLSFGDVKSLVASSSILWPELIEAVCQRRRVEVGAVDVGRIQALMTPREILEQTEHSREIIDPSIYDNFEFLKSRGDLIRDLKLVPKKPDEIHQSCHQVSKDIFAELIEQHYLNGSSMSWTEELFPSDLPKDVGQYVVWLADDNLSEAAAKFITKVMVLAGLSESDVILFERSRVTETDFVKAAIPKYRHIHVWTRHEVEL